MTTPTKTESVVAAALGVGEALLKVAEGIERRAKADERRAYLTRKKREQRERAKLAGKCVICAKNPAQPGRTACLECTQSVVDWQRRNGWPKSARTKASDN